MLLTYLELFGENPIMENNLMILSKEVLEKVIVGSAINQIHWLIALHEVLRKTFLSYLYINSEHDYLQDPSRTIVSDYSNHYDDIKCITLGKRLNHQFVVLGFLWKFENPFLSTINAQEPLIIVEDSIVSIDLSLLGFPLSPIAFCQAFIEYLAKLENPLIRIQYSYLVEIFFQNNLPLLRLEDIING